MFLTAILGIGLLVRTYDYAQNPSKLVFGHAHKAHVEVKHVKSLKKGDERFAAKIDSLMKSRGISSLHRAITDAGKVNNIEETSFLGIKAKRITYERSYSLGEGFWFMLSVILVQLCIISFMWFLKSHEKKHEAL